MLLKPLLPLLPLLLAFTPTTALSDISCTTWTSPDCGVQDTALANPGDSQTVQIQYYGVHVATNKPFSSMRCNRDLRDQENVVVTILPRGFDPVTGKDAGGHFAGKAWDVAGSKCTQYVRKMPKNMATCQAVPGTCFVLNAK